MAFYFHDTDLKIRVSNAVYCVHLLRLWRQDLHNKFGSDASKFFVSTNTFEGCELNLISILSLAMRSKAEYIHMMSSQQCEHYFRMLRSFSTIESTIVNFSMKDLITKLGRILFIDDLVFKHKDTFIFPRTNYNEDLSKSKKLSETEISSAINAGIRNAEHEASSLGINVTTIHLNLFIKKSRILVTESIDEDEVDEDQNEGEETDFFHVEDQDETIADCTDEENIVKYKEQDFSRIKNTGMFFI